MTSEILSAIQTLTRPPGGTSSLGVQSSQQASLLAALRVNQTLLQQRLRDDNGLEEVRRLREEVQEEEKGWLKYNSTEQEEQEEQVEVWTFVHECLLLLLTLRRHLSNELQRFQQTPPSPLPPSSPDFAPPLPPDVLSVSQQRTLRAALQLLLGLGLCPYLAPGVGTPLSRRSSLGVVVEKLVTEGAGPEGARRLLTTTRVLLELSELTSLSTLVLTQHLGDLIAALCQLGHQPHPQGQTQLLSAEERVWCKEALNNLLGKVYQPMVIKELLILQGGPKQSCPGKISNGSNPSPAPGSCPAWLRRVCGQLLSQRLIQPNGVQAVVRAILEGGAGGESDWRKCDAVARILVACPQQSASADQYFRLVCPQILDLLHFKDKLTALQFQRVATRAALCMVQERLSFARQYLLKPMLNPLHHCTTAPDEGDAPVVVDEEQLTRCVDDVYKVWVIGNSPSAPLLEALEEVLPVIFTLFCFTKKNVSHLRAPCQEVLLWYLSHSEPSAAQLTLRRLSGLLKGAKEVCEDLQFTPGSDGGAQLSHRENCRDEEQDLYEKLSGGQWRLECLMELLSGLKDSDLPGDFFLHLLQDLTCWASSAEETGEEESVDVSGMSLLEAECRLVGVTEQRGRSLDLLQVVAVMVESLQHEQLLRKTSQVVDFLVSLLHRACVGLDGGRGPAVENPVESQTLSMGMGLVATLLSGPQLRAEDFSSMSRLLPPLDTLSRLHPEVFIQELASNLRAVIATHGAYQPQDLHNTVPTNPNNPEPAAETSPNPHPRFTQSSASSTPRGRGGTSDTFPPSKPLSDWLLEACDPDIPTRAFALRNLTNMIQTREPDTAWDEEKVLTLFLENLEHEDSFIYLSAIQGLAALADSHPERILERLLKDFQQGPSLPSSNRERSLETRLKVGEVLMRASRAMGDLAPHLGRPLVGVFLRGTRDPDVSVRVSSLSNLGELCQRLDYALGPLAQELSSCLTALIKTEKEVEVRRAAVHVIVLLIRGLGDKITQVLGEVLLDLYRALKRACVCDGDEVVVLHAGLALEELEEVMRRLVFPQQKLEKKIVVLP